MHVEYLAICYPNSSLLSSIITELHAMVFRADRLTQTGELKARSA